MKKIVRYKRKITPRLYQRKEFVLQHLRDEWVAGEKGIKREDALRMVKAGGIAFGKGLLVFLALAGVIIVAAVAPNILGAFGRFRKRKNYTTYVHRKYFQNELRYLQRQKYVTAKREINEDGEVEYTVSPTDIGIKKVLKESLKKFQIITPAKWDGLWRIIIFDIPDTHKSAREGFRERLRALGFYPLQKSVFIYPYPCERELEFLTFLYDLAGCTRFIETSRLEHDYDLKDYFNFPKDG